MRSLCAWHFVVLLAFQAKNGFNFSSRAGHDEVIKRWVG